jgi:hypothetical protein
MMDGTTSKGEHIAMQIQGETAYGSNGDLTLADVWLIIDNIHTHFMDTDRDTAFLENWLDDLYRMEEADEKKQV